MTAAPPHRRPGRRGSRPGPAERAVLVFLLAAVAVVGGAGWGPLGSASAGSAPRVLLAPSFGPGGPAPSPSATSLDLNASVARVGASLTATGAGFLPNTTANFTIQGRPMPAACQTDPEGSIGGVGGGSCHVTVPAVPGGNGSVVAATGGTGYGDPLYVGGSPGAVAYDPTDGKLFVTDRAQSSVEVLRTSNFTLEGRIPVGRSPVALAYDPAVDQLFVANSASNNLTVVDAANDSVVANVTVGSEPSGIAVAGNSSEVFVADFNSNSVDVVNVTNDSVTATIGVGSGPSGIAYAPASNQVWVANLGSVNLSVVDVRNLSVARSIAVASQPSQLLVDSAADEAFVAYPYAGRLAVVSLTTDSLVANVSLSTLYPTGLALDAALGELFVICDYGAKVCLVSDVTNTLIANTTLAASADGVAFDPAGGYAVLANQGAGTLSRLSPAKYAIAPLRVESALTPPGLRDSGQAATVSATGFGAFQRVVDFSVGGRPVNCTAAGVGTCAFGGVLWTAANGSLVASYVVPSVPDPGSYALNLTDRSGLTATALEPIDPAPEVGTPVASRPSVDLGQSVYFSLAIQYGQPPYNVTWQGLPRGCHGTVANLSCQPTHAGGYSVSATIVDSVGAVAQSSPLPFTVLADPTVGTPSASSPWLALGQSVTFSVGVNGGAAPLAVRWVGLPAGCPTVGDPLNCTPTAPGPTTLYAVVTDANGFLLTSPGLYFTVDQYPIEVSANASTAALDLGGDVTFQASASAGAGDFRYLWSDMPTGCADDAATVACTPSTAGTYYVTVGVTDANGFTVYSVPIVVRVYADPAVRVELGRTTLDAGETVDLTAFATNGSGSYSFAWHGLPPGCAGTASIVPCVPEQDGVFDITVSVTDSESGAAKSAPAVLTVWLALGANLTVFPASPTVGVSTELGLTYSGGAPPILARWELPGPVFGSGWFVNYTFSSAGSQYVTVWLNDSTGASVELVFPVDVGVRTAGAAPSPWSAYGLPLALLVAAVAIGVVVAVRRRPPKPGPTRPSVGAALGDATLYGVPPPGSESELPP